MKMKKVTALLLTVAMAATMLAGCGSKEEKAEGKKEDGKTVLKFAAFEGGNGAEIWKNIEKAFEEEHKDVDVELHLSSELDKDLQKDFKNGNVPDVVYYNLGQESGFVETMLKEKAIADISDVFDDELKGKLVGGITENAAAQPYGDGKVYLAPIIYTPTGLWYNKDLFEGANKKYDLPTTWDEFFALGDKAKADGISLFTYPQSGYFDATMYQMLAQAGGIDFYNKAVNYDEKTWTSEEGKKVVDTIAKLASPDYIQADTVANANADGGFKINQQDTVVDLMLNNKVVNKETNEESAAPIVSPVLGASDKLEDGTIKDTYTLASSDGYEAVAGTWATTKPIDGFDMKATVYGAIDALNTGEMTADQYQKQLVDAWEKLLENVE